AIGSDPAEGMTRLLYPHSWLAAQKYVQSQTEAFGLGTQFHEVGNLFCRVAGTQFPQETILTGSHIDTLVNSGTLDG
ncbi:allantoate deiminase, partial [Enterococcus faecalis]